MILGVDTASVAGNKTIDWTAAKAAGLSFAIVRSNWGDQTDTMFAREWPRVRDAGLVRGAYLFLRYPQGSKKAPSPVDQAWAMIRTLGPLEPGDLPPALDLEFPGAGRSETGMSVQDCLDWAMNARNVLKNEYGIDPMLYTSARVWRDDLGNSDSTGLVESPLWLARYPFKSGQAVRAGAAFDGMNAPPVPPPWGGDAWWIHQYQGDATGFPGFPTGNVDMNRFNPLFKGATGARVKWVQKRLGYQPANISGKFDETTDTDVRAFQSLHELVADGIVGPRTFAYLASQKV